MAPISKMQIKLPHVSWRDGRPRFNPGPKLRALKFQGKDLRHPAGAWFTAEEALAWVRTELVPEIERRRAAKLSGQRIRSAGKRVYSVKGLLTEWTGSPAYARDLAPKTQSFYGQMAKVLEEEAAELLAEPAAGLTQPKAFNLYESILEARGLATARGAIATLSAAYSWALRRGKVTMTVHPCLKLGMKEPEPRVRAGEVHEMAALVAAADAMGRPEIGDMIVLGLWSGQRQADRLALVESAVMDNRRYFRQAKTGAIVMVPDSDQLAQRIAAARARRRELTVQSPNVIVDETSGLPFTNETYRKLFAKVRATAVEGIPGRLPSTPSLADFTDQDLRDTSVTWLARAGATEGEIAAITGHTIASIKRILKHYLAMHPELADSAIAKLSAWHTAKRNGQ